MNWGCTLPPTLRPLRSSSTLIGRSRLRIWLGGVTVDRANSTPFDSNFFLKYWG